MGSSIRCEHGDDGSSMSMRSILGTFAFAALSLPAAYAQSSVIRICGRRARRRMLLDRPPLNSGFG
jgi:hypothetical protein